MKLLVVSGILIANILIRSAVGKSVSHEVNKETVAEQIEDLIDEVPEMVEEAVEATDDDEESGEVTVDDWILPPSRSESTAIEDHIGSDGNQEGNGAQAAMQAFLKLPDVIENELSNATSTIREQFKNASSSLHQTLEGLHNKLREDVSLVMTNNTYIPSPMPGFFDSINMVSVYLKGLSEAFAQVVESAKASRDPSLSDVLEKMKLQIDTEERDV